MSKPSPSHRSANLAHPTPPCLPGFTPKTPCATVILHHALPGGESHFDWLLAVEPHGVEPLITFRMGQRVDEMSFSDNCGVAGALSIGRHRPSYLEYEGPVSGDRGEVKRVARGAIEQWAITDLSHWRLVICWQPRKGRAAVSQHLRLCRSDSDMMHWEVSIAKPA